MSGNGRRRSVDSFFEAEQRARRLTRRYVVVECREDEELPSGVEATFVVCPEDQVHTVKNGREVAFTAEIVHPTEERYRSALIAALAHVQRLLERVPDEDTELRPALESIRLALYGGLHDTPIGG